MLWQLIGCTDIINISKNTISQINPYKGYCAIKIPQLGTFVNWHIKSNNKLSYSNGTSTNNFNMSLAEMRLHNLISYQKISPSISFAYYI